MYNVEIVQNFVVYFPVRDDQLARRFLRFPDRNSLIFVFCIHDCIRLTEMYGSQQTPYPTQQPPYPTQQPPYPTQQPPYPTQQPPYPTQQPPYPTQQPSYPSEPFSSQQQPPYCVPPSYDEAISGKYHQVPQPSSPFQASPRPYQGFPPEHTITICPQHQTTPCDCPPQQYPIVIQQEVARTQNSHQCVKCIFIVLVILFFSIFFGILVKSAINFHKHFDD
ncbi:hypothetical protein GE061_002929 [Apolygus lucorum]|uniref:Uncharacterized protein n=1 Tax=Apolygus lucorum TaxID=248454 RepID=A0A6A4JRN8_APOLU|nr:hypothetical protein GE061_002929 [Apolygus lucorum]